MYTPPVIPSNNRHWPAENQRQKGNHSKLWEATLEVWVLEGGKGVVGGGGGKPVKSRGDEKRKREKGEEEEERTEKSKQEGRLELLSASGDHKS